MNALAYAHPIRERQRMACDEGRATDDGRPGDESSEPQIGGYALSEIVRRIRRTADLSQRELAKFARVSAALIGGIEKGRATPSLATLQRILNAANCQLVAVDADGCLVAPLLVWKDTADGAGRRYPAHLDTILDPVGGDWWASVYGLTYPPETFRRNRAYRDWQRAQSVWEVRVKQNRSAPRPRAPYGGAAWLPDAD